MDDGQKNIFPSKRSIIHQIYFIQGDYLTNGAAYNMTLQKNKEIAKQIKSIRPCIVPTILASKKGGTWRLCIDS